MNWNVGDMAKVFDVMTKTPSFVAIDYVTDGFCTLINTSTIIAVEFYHGSSDKDTYAVLHFNYEGKDGKLATHKVTDAKSISNLQKLQ
ncbi:MAG: hypothetical protein WBM86_26385 [Waterburya sp.]